jgi:hypothetical protein
MEMYSYPPANEPYNLDGRKTVWLAAAMLIEVLIN